MIGSAAAIIALRLHGAIYGFVTITVIHLLNTVVVGFEPRNLTVMIAHFIGIDLDARLADPLEEWQPNQG